MKHTHYHHCTRGLTLSVFLFATLLIHGAPPPGLNIWYLTQNLGSLTDVLANTVDTLAASALTCSARITQAQIPYTITAPGYYCLAESVNAATDAITIASSYATLDLRGHSITATSTNFCVNNPSSAYTDIAVQNGRLIAASQLFSCNSDNVTLDNLTCRGTNPSSNALISVASTTNGFVLSNSVMYGVSLFLNGSVNSIITDCLFYGSSTSSTPGLTSQSCSDSVITNCVFSGYGSFGLFFNGGTNISLINCYALGNSTTGFFFTGFLTNTILACTLQNCYSLGNRTHGFEVDFPAITTMSNISLNQCVAAYNTRSGFFVDIDQDTLLSGQIIGCTALANGQYGFTMENTSGTNLNFWNNAAHKNTLANFNLPVFLPTNAIVIHPDKTDDYWVNVAVAP